MIKSKAAVFACVLLFVSVADIASAVSEANQPLPEKHEAANVNTVEESKQYCHHGCCRYYGHRCAKCCGSVAEAQANTNKNKRHDDEENDAATRKEREVEATQNGWRHGGGHRGGWGGGHGKSGGGN